MYLPTKKHRFVVLLNDEEKNFVDEKRRSMGMGISEFFRSLLRKVPVQLPDRELRDQMIRLCHDLNKIGGLLKMELTNSERFINREGSREKVEALHSKLNSVVESIGTAIAGRRG